ncbi:Metallo-dependent phosphatase-like protein [Hyaloraphidium curvatum]|nr:Metallo-dependent phosphatase-like protein [Hyaloraphidium curvatum]
MRRRTRAAALCAVVAALSAAPCLALPAPAQRVLAKPPAPASAEPLRFLHLTDLHYDPDYRERATTYSQCHRVPADGNQRRLAGKYGMLGTDCDASVALVEESLGYIRKRWGRDADPEDRIDLVLWTGDSARHDRDPAMPMTTRDVIDHNQACVDLMRNIFDSDVVVVPNIGNHDVHPANHMSPPPPLPQMLEELRDPKPASSTARPHPLTLLLRTWSPFLFSTDQPWEHANITNDFLTFGSFARTAIPGDGGLVVVSLNTLWYFPSNDGGGKCHFRSEWQRRLSSHVARGSDPLEMPEWDIAQDPTSGEWSILLRPLEGSGEPARSSKISVPSASLLWLHNVLIRARRKRQTVLVIGHIPPMGYGPLWHRSCGKWFGRMMGDAMERGVVGGWWSGHTNEDGVTFAVRDRTAAAVSEEEDDADDLIEVPIEDEDELDGGIGAEKKPRGPRDLSLAPTWKLLSLAPDSAEVLSRPAVEIAGALYTAPSLVPARNPSFRIGTLLPPSDRSPGWSVAGWTQHAVALNRANKREVLDWQVEYETGSSYGLGSSSWAPKGGDRGVGKRDTGIQPHDWRSFVARYAKNVGGIKDKYELFRDVEGVS